MFNMIFSRTMTCNMYVRLYVSVPMCRYSLLGDTMILGLPALLAYMQEGIEDMVTFRTRSHTPSNDRAYFHFAELAVHSIFNDDRVTVYCKLMC